MYYKFRLDIAIRYIQCHQARVKHVNIQDFSTNSQLALISSTNLNVLTISFVIISRSHICSVTYSIRGEEIINLQSTIYSIKYIITKLKNLFSLNNILQTWHVEGFQ